MNKFLILIFICSLIACDKEDPNASLCYTLIERQCQSDPFHVWYKDIKKIEDRETAIKSFLNHNDIVPFLLKANAPSTDAVCLACSCPSGYSYKLIIKANDEEKLNSLNLSLVKIGCD